MELSDIDPLDRDRFTQGVPHEWLTYLRNNAPVYRHPEPDGPGFLARMELKAFFDEPVRRVPRVEPLGDADRLRSNFIAGITHLPVRFHAA